ncbi:MAG: methyltransferase domain-containing protein [Acidobacteriota bacterium]|nr:methyltransferase domain-containing protein [Acidobacteriota bacterium]
MKNEAVKEKVEVKAPVIRSLEEIANATPEDYTSNAPTDPTSVAVQMISTARNRFPRNGDGDPNYRFLYIGPGAGMVVKELINQEHQARGVETSKRGITSAPSDVWNYVGWQLPWELTLGDRTMDVCFINRYLETLLTPDEWSMTVKEVERVSKYHQII